MTIKLRTALALLVVVSVLLLVFAFLVYNRFVAFGEEQFNDQLRQKARNTLILLEEVKEVDSTLLRLIDVNTLNELREEKVMIFTTDGKLVYASLDEAELLQREKIFAAAREKGELLFEQAPLKGIALYYDKNGLQRIVVALARDRAGEQQARSLANILVMASLATILLTALASYFFARKTLQPLEQLNQEVQSVSGNTLRKRIPVQQPSAKDEISQLAQSFNTMLQRLDEAFDNQKRFIQHASHELRTPLAAMTAQVEQALNKERTPQEYQALLQSLQEDQDQLTRLTNQLLLLFRAEGGTEAIAKEPVRVDELVEQVLDQLRPAYPDTQFSVRYDPFPESEEDLTVTANRPLLHTVLQNLCENAAKYAQSPQITITLSGESNGCRFRVANDGPLIPAEDQPTLFQPFFRAANRSGKKGFGLGLVLAKRIATLHGGTLNYETGDGLNQFVLHLPK